MFSQKDIEQIQQKGMQLPLIQKQIEHFIKGFPFINLVRPARSGDGIIVFNESQVDQWVNQFEVALRDKRIVKFVPASGAASRMFKHLFEFTATYIPGEEGSKLFNKDQGFNSVYYFIRHIQEFAFYQSLSEQLSTEGYSLESLIQEENYTPVIDYLLSSKGLDYANLPKALIKFHDYADGPRTAAEEHLVESAEYSRDITGSAHIHFTISPEHKEKFQELFKSVKSRYEESLGVRFDISYSIQKPSTDTIAVNEDNIPVRTSEGTLLFRPGGHGALIDNLNELEADLIFVKNIDNILPDRLKGDTFKYKKVIGGYLVFIKALIDNYLEKLSQQVLTIEEIKEIAQFATDELYTDLPSDFLKMPLEFQTHYLISLLNRPVRVCGMVRNEGEPGGGPFWISDDTGRLSLQIVESSQIDFTNPSQKSIVSEATHFNPVDLVCTTRDFRGEKFDLHDFIDENTGFISLKSSGGKTLKAQELPGLWNGAMAKWITIFVEVPIITFNPVKTVNDLLRGEHRSL